MIFNLVAIAAVVALTFVKVFPFSSQLFAALGAMAIGIYRSDGRVQRWFRIDHDWRSMIAWGVVGGLAVIAADAALYSIYPLLGIAPAKLDRFASVRGNLFELLEWLALIWTIVALTEELISRAFLIDQWTDLLPAGRVASALAVVFSSMTFSALHVYQGMAGAISNFVAGVILGVIYLQRGRTLGSNVIAHAIADSLGLVAIFLGLAA